MDLQNLGYALTQIVHNFGATAVVGGAVASLWLAPRAELHRCMAWLVLSGWAAQMASGATFGAISFYYYGQFPDLSTVAMVALATKVACAVSGFALAAIYLRYGASQTESWHRGVWLILASLATTALTAAAFLRWFS